MQDCSRALSEILLRMTEREQENLEPQEQGHDQDALDEQEAARDSQDERERDDAGEGEQ
jgi:hypothetical protein